uniref:PhoH-like protein n=1 Tax=Dictyoglomus turgidum TaxID=513050 RepID=A0A7C3WLV7_9BACT
MERTIINTEILIPKELQAYKENITKKLKEIEEIEENIEIKILEDRIIMNGSPEVVKRVEQYICDQINNFYKKEPTNGSKLLIFDKKIVKVLTPGQKRYVEAIEKNEIVIAKGPAGTGKSFLAVAMGISFLRNNMVKKIVLTRPVVEAGEKLGFLPGDIQQKVDPYVRPLYDFLEELLGQERLLKYIERNIIEIVPLAYMRGRTFKDSFVLLDEAQNTTPIQMKMFLTRFGFGSKMVVTGDVTQTDLETNKMSGLIHAWKILQGIKGIAFVELTEEDVVRHDIVKEIIKAYEKWEKKLNECKCI